MDFDASDRLRIKSGRWLAWGFACALMACGGGGGEPEAAVDAAPPAPAPAPAPAPVPAPPPAEAPLPAIATAVSLEDNPPIGVDRWPDGATATGGQGQPVQGLSCGGDDLRFHVHTHLSIILNGQALAIPPNIGIVQTLDCKYRIHTHDRSGKLHIEGSAPALRTLGEFFAIWGRPLARDNVADLTGLPIDFFVTDNGVVTRYHGDPAEIVLASHRHIAIQVGSPIAEVPFFTWSGE